MADRRGAALALVLVAACASLAAPRVKTEPQALRSGQYALDQTHAALTFKIDHMGFSKFAGRFERFGASLDFDADHPTFSRVEVVIDIASLDVANDAFAATLIGPQWFHAARYPQARFISTHVEKTGDRTGRVTGDLTLHGVTAPVVLDVVFNGGAQDLLRGAYIVGFSARGSVSRKDFGVDKHAGIVGDNVEIEIEAEFARS